MAALDTDHAEVLGRFLRDDAGAIDCIRKLFQIVHICDDLIDRDRDVANDEVAAAFWLALVDLPSTAFYAQHEATLRPILAAAMINWLAATAMERGDDPADLPISFVLRSSYVDLLTMSALIVGGLAWAVEITPDIRRWVHAEGFDGYVQNLAAEREARRVR